jgi:hypothetical protein
VTVLALRPKAPLVWLAPLPILAGFLIGSVWLDSLAFGATLMLGGLVALVLHPVLTEREANHAPLLVGLAAVTGVALATVGFALAKGTGMALALLAAVAVLAILGNSRALVAMGPLLGVVLFRVFRSTFPETSRAFDIGQHYAIIGLLVGAIVPLVVADWMRTSGRDSSRVGWQPAVAALLVAVMLIALPPFGVAFFAAFGTVGLIIGFGLAGLLESVRQGSSPVVLAVGAGLSGLLLLGYRWMGAFLDFTREDKVALLGWFSVGVLILGALVAWLSRGPGKGEASTISPGTPRPSVGGN